MSVGPLPLGLMPRAGAGLYMRDVLVEYGRVTNYRAEVRRLGAVRHWFLGDLGTTIAQDEITTDGSGDGTYVGALGAARGMLPEFGLATAFDGDGISIPHGLAVGNVAFSIVAMLRPQTTGPDAKWLFWLGGDTSAAALWLQGNLVLGPAGVGYYQVGPVPLDVPMFICATYGAGRARVGFSTDMITLQLTDVVASAAMSVTAAGGWISPVGLFVGAMQGAAIFNRALTVAELESIMATARWHELAGATVNDVEASDALVIDGGIHEDSPLTRIAASGTCTFTLDNSEFGGAAIGRYSPGHIHCRPGWDRGAMIRVRSVTSTGTAPLFLGTVRTIKPTAGVYGERRVQVLATDWLDEAARRPVHGIPTLLNERADQVIWRLVNAMRNRPHALALSTGTDVYPFVLDATTDKQDSIFGALKDVADSERGLIYMRGDGTLCFENRNDRQIFSLATGLLEDVLSAELTRAADDVINRVEVTLHPRKVDAAPTTILYAADTVQEYESVEGGTIVWLPFRDPVLEATRIGGTDIQPLTPTTDYLVNTAPDGSGLNITGDPRVVLRLLPEAVGVHLVVENTWGSTVYLTKLQVRGRGLYHYDPITVVAQDAASIEATGSQLAQFDMPYQTRIGVADATARQLLYTFMQAPTRVDAVPFWIFQNAAYERLAVEGAISTRLRFREPMGAIDSEFFVNAKRLEVRAAGDVDCTVWLTPADMTGFARWDISLFDAPGARFAY